MSKSQRIINNGDRSTSDVKNSVILKTSLFILIAYLIIWAYLKFRYRFKDDEHNCRVQMKWGKYAHAYNNKITSKHTQTHTHHGQIHRDLKACLPAEQQTQMHEWSWMSTSEAIVIWKGITATRRKLQGSCLTNTHTLLLRKVHWSHRQLSQQCSEARLATPAELVQKIKSRKRASHLAN